MNARPSVYTVLSLLLGASLLAACDSAGPGTDTCPDPGNPACGGPVDGTVSEYMTTLPSWDQFKPDVPEQPATATGAPIEEAPVTMDVTTLDENGELSVSTTGPQGAGRLSSMAAANCLIVVEPDRTRVEPGERVGVQLLHGLLP